MTFIDTRLSTCVGVNFSGGPEWSTVMTQMASGIARYQANWAMAHHKYTADYSVFEPEEQNEILAAFMAARGQLHSFRFKDWNDYIADDQAMDLGDGTSTPRQLTKAYQFGTEVYVRDILLPLESTLVVTANDSPLAVDVDPLTGLVTPITTWPSGQVIKASFEFDVRVRFGMDFAPFSREGRPMARATVSLVEAFTP